MSAIQRILRVCVKQWRILALSAALAVVLFAVRKPASSHAGSHDSAPVRTATGPGQVAQDPGFTAPLEMRSPGQLFFRGDIHDGISWAARFLSSRVTESGRFLYRSHTTDPMKHHKQYSWLRHAGERF